MFQLETLKYALLIIVACLGGKALAAAFAHGALKVSRDESMLMWAVSMPQAAATLAATTVGFEIGLFSTVVVNAVLVLILVSIITSTLLVPPISRRIAAPMSEEVAIGERVVLAVPHERPSPATTQLAAGLARRDGGIVEVLLLRDGRNGQVDRAPVAALSNVAVMEGFDGGVHVAVDRSLAHAVVHGSTDLGASIVVVEADRDGDDDHVGLRSWEEAVAATLSVPLVLVNGRGTATKRVLVACNDTSDLDPAAHEFAGRLARAVARGEVVELHVTDHDWIEELRAGDLAFTAVPTFDLIMGLPDPPAGAALAAIPVETLPRTSST
jgi:hypothetical protein